jgi:hypothetical protein
MRYHLVEKPYLWWGRSYPLSMGVEKGGAWVVMYLFESVQGTIQRRKNHPTSHLEANR